MTALPDDNNNRMTRPRAQCSATSKATGERCRCRPIRGGTVSHKHGGSAPQVKRKAAERIRAAADDAASYLVRWMADEAVDKRLRVQIAQDLLDRAGISKTQTVGVEVRKFEQMLDAGQLVVDLPVIDGEVLDAPDDTNNNFIVKVEHPVPAPTDRPRQRRTRRSP